MGVEYYIFCKLHKRIIHLGKGLKEILGEKISDEEYYLSDNFYQKIIDNLQLENIPEENLLRKLWERKLILLSEFLEEHKNCDLRSCSDLYDYIWTDKHYKMLPDWKRDSVFDDDIFKSIFSRYVKDMEHQAKPWEELHKK